MYLILKDSGISFKFYYINKKELMPLAAETEIYGIYESPSVHI